MHASTQGSLFKKLSMAGALALACSTATAAKHEFNVRFFESEQAIRVVVDDETGAWSQANAPQDVRIVLPGRDEPRNVVAKLRFAEGYLNLEMDWWLGDTTHLADKGQKLTVPRFTHTGTYWIPFPMTDAFKETFDHPKSATRVQPIHITYVGMVK